MRRYCTSVLRPPDLAQDHVVRQHLAGMRHQQPQQIVLPRRELHLLAAHRHDPPHQIDREIAGAEHRLLALLLQPMPLRRADPRQQFVDAERLRHVVVGAEIERRHLGRLVARGWTAR